MITFFVYMLEILSIEITKFMEALIDLIPEKIEDIPWFDDFFGSKTKKDFGKDFGKFFGKFFDKGSPDNNEPENSGPDNNEPENSGPDKNDPNKDSNEGSDKPKLLDKGKGKAVDSNPDDLPEQGINKRYPLKEEAEIKEEEEEFNYQVARLAKIQGELGDKAGESSTGGLLAEQLKKIFEEKPSDGVKQQPSEGVQQQPSAQDIYLNAYYEIQEKYLEAVRRFNDTNEILTGPTHLDERERAELIAESQRLRADADSITKDLNHIRSLVDIPSEPENYDSEEEYSGEDYDSDNNSEKESSDEESRPSKRPRN